MASAAHVMASARLRAGVLHQLPRNRKAIAGLAILAGFVLLALVGPWFVGDPSDYLAVPLQPPSAEFLLGTNGQGQDVLAQTVCGARMTLLIGFVVGVVVLALGSAVGIAAGYFGGWVDDALSLFTNVFLIIPGLPLAVVIAAYLPSGPWTIALVLILTGWSWHARVMRAQTLALRNRDCIAAAVVVGESTFRVMFFELLPNMTSLLVSGFIGATVFAINAQVGLEYLGLGDVNEVTWGTNLYWAANNAALLTESWWTFIPTGVCVALVGFALVLLNSAIDEVANPRLRTERSWLKGLSTPVARRDD